MHVQYLHFRYKYNINNNLKIAKVLFHEVAVREYESYALLFLHLHIVTMFDSYFRFGLVEKVVRRHYCNALNN